MSLKKTFSSFVNEASFIKGYPKPKNKLGQKQWKQWLDMMTEIEDMCEDMRTTAEFLRDKYDYNLHSREYRANGYEFNVKMYDIPGVDVDELLNKYFDGSEQDLDQTWVDFVAIQVEQFVEDLWESYKMDWIKDYYQVGRMGGWLVLELEEGTWSENQVEHELDSFESDFNYESEDLVEYDDETETFKADMKELKKVYKVYMSNIKEFKKALDKHQEDLETIKKQIPIVQAGMGVAFKEYIEGNY